MTRRAVPWRALLAGSLLAVALPLLSPVGPASAAPCTGSTGVTVVVGSSVGCAPGHPSTALEALHATGYTTTMVATAPAFLCRIDGAPASDPCLRIPPANAYWSFWTAKPGGHWVYTNLAVTQPLGSWSVVGFAFGAGSPPPVPPPAAPAATPTPTPPPTTSTGATTHATAAHPATSTPSLTARPSGAAPAPSVAPSATPRASTATRSATGSPTADPGSSGPTTPVALGRTQAASGVSPLGWTGPLPVGIGLALLAALGAGTAYTIRRRRV